jgi:hypothetical protein
VRPGLSNRINSIFPVCKVQAESHYNQSNSIFKLKEEKHMSLQERRHSERFNLGVPLTVRWTNSSGQRQARAVTQDVSSGGMYFCLPEAIPDGTAVEIEMTLPTQITLGTPVRVRCTGRIQRCVLKQDESTGMATMIEKYEFLSDTEDVA